MRDPLRILYLYTVDQQDPTQPVVARGDSVVGGTGAGVGAEFHGFAATAIYTTATMLNTCEQWHRQIGQGKASDERWLIKDQLNRR